MRLPSYLMLSPHHIFYFRFPLHKFFSHPASKREFIKLSLGTRCPREALYLAGRMAYFGPQLVDQWVAQGMNYIEIKRHLQDHFGKRLQSEKIARQKRGPFSEEMRKGLASVIENQEYAAKTDNYELIGEEEDVEKYIALHSLPIEQGSENFVVLRRELARHKAQHFRDLLAFSEEVSSIEYRGEGLSPAIEAKPAPSKTIREYFEDYLADKLGDKAIRPKTAEAQRHKLNVLLQIIGENSPLELHAETADKVKQTLRKLPKNFTRSPRYKGKSLEEVTALGSKDALDEKTVVDYLGAYSSFYDWLMKRDLVEKNRFKGLAPKVKNGKGGRDAFTDEAIKEIFNAILKGDPKKINKPQKKWGPLIAAYTGARLNEIASLTKADIRKEDVIWCFDFNDEGENKQLKNENSRRLVPIHDALIGLGFLDYCKALGGDTKARLFPDLNYSKANGYGAELGKWFTRLLAELRLKTPKISFHSFRHTVATKLQRAGVEPTLAQAITGHTNQGAFFDYAKGHTPAQLKEAVDKIKYPYP